MRLYIYIGLLTMYYQHIPRHNFSYWRYERPKRCGHSLKSISGWQSIAQIHLCTLGGGQVIPKGSKDNTLSRNDDDNDHVSGLDLHWNLLDLHCLVGSPLLIGTSTMTMFFFKRHSWNLVDLAERQTFPWIRRTQR